MLGAVAAFADGAAGANGFGTIVEGFISGATDINSGSD
jgi:hypothetical protein